MQLLTEQAWTIKGPLYYKSRLACLFFLRKLGKKASCVCNIVNPGGKFMFSLF